MVGRADQSYRGSTGPAHGYMHYQCPDIGPAHDYMHYLRHGFSPPEGDAVST
jgi:hypothetical protein